MAAAFNFGRWPLPRIAGLKASARGSSLAAKMGPQERLPPHAAQRRLGADGFYAKFGYRAQGLPFEENTVPHIRMSKRLA
jgi:predicted GNAT family N-acyltransferase